MIKPKSRVETPLGAFAKCQGGTLLGPDSPHNFWAQGDKFVKAAKILAANGDQELEWPMFYLVCQGSELFLKAFLRSRGISVKKLKRDFGHDLQHLFESAQKLGSDRLFSNKLRELVQIISETYERQHFRYVHVGEWELHDVRIFLKEVESLGHHLEC